MGMNHLDPELFAHLELQLTEDRLRVANFL